MNEGLLTALAPGLLALVVARLLTQSERPWDAVATAVYGLALTVIANLGWLVVRTGLSLGMDVTQPWVNRELSPVGAQVIGILLGVLLAMSSKYDLIGWLRRRFDMPDLRSVWLGGFGKHAQSYVLLTLTDGQRVYGYARAVSKEEKDGHILLERASFSTPLETFAPGQNPSADRGRILLLRISDVSSVEFYGTIHRDEYALKGQSL